MSAWFDAPNVGLRPAHDRLGVLQDGRLIAMGKNYVVTVFTNGCEVINVRVPDLRKIDYVLDVELHLSPLDCSYPVYEAVNKVKYGNVVGMTIFGAARGTGTTLTVEVIAIGPP